MKLIDVKNIEDETDFENAVIEQICLFLKIPRELVISSIEKISGSDPNKEGFFESVKKIVDSETITKTYLEKQKEEDQKHRATNYCLNSVCVDNIDDVCSKNTANDCLYRMTESPISDYSLQHYLSHKKSLELLVLNKVILGDDFDHLLGYDFAFHSNVSKLWFSFVEVVSELLYVKMEEMNTSANIEAVDKILDRKRQECAIYTNYKDIDIAKYYIKRISNVDKKIDVLEVTNKINSYIDYLVIMSNSKDKDELKDSADYVKSQLLSLIIGNSLGSINKYLNDSVLNNGDDQGK